MIGSRKSRPVAWHLAALCLVLSLPLLGVAAWTTLRYAAAERAGLEGAARKTVDGVASATEREMARYVVMLQALATSPAIDDGDLRRFRVQASELAGAGGTNIVLIGLDGRQLVNTRVPPGAPLAQYALQPVHRTVLATGRPQVSDLTTGSGTGRSIVIVGVPVQRDGRVISLLSVSVPVEELAALIAREAPPPPYFTSISDRAGRILARSGDPGAVGKFLPGFADLRGMSGTWSGTNIAGVDVFGIYDRLPSTGWTIATGVTQAALDAPLRRSLLILTGTAFLLLSLGAAAAFAVARQIARSAASVASLARALGEGRAVSVPPLAVKEAVVVGEALADASRGLRERDTALEASRAELQRANAELETRVEARTRELAESEARYRLLAENTGDVIVLGHADGRRYYVSPAVRSMLGYSQKEALTAHLQDLVHPDDLGRVIATIRGISPEYPHASVTHRARHRDGHWLWIEAAYRRSDGEDAPMVAYLRDVTTRQQAAEELEAAKAAAEAAAQAKSDFLATMSHEIRTPLNGIIGFAGLILDRSDLAPDLRRQVRLVLTAGTSLLTVVNDVLDLSKIEAGGIALHLRPFAMESLVENTASLVRGAAEAKGLALIVEVGPNVPAWLIGDEDRLRQVLLNLLNNAVKFTHRGQVVLSVAREGADPRGARLCFAVSDTGIGIPVESQVRLFQRFSQMDGSISREFGGTGLGLAICKHLVELMGGTVGISSRPGEGSTFWCMVTLPYGPPALLPEALPTEQHPARRRSGRILVVDDTPMNQEIACAVLEQAGYAVEVASDGPSAIEAVRTGGYQLVLMDVQMPGMTGVDATRRIRELPEPMRSVPVIAMTANVLPDQVSDYKRAGMDDHVGKPVDREQLYAAVDRWLREPAQAPDAAGPAEAAAPDAPFFDDAAYRQLAGLLGGERTAGYLARLRDVMRDGFAPVPGSPDAILQLKDEAHVMVSQAGMLGFARLSQACRRLDEACARGGDVRAALSEVRAMRDGVVAHAHTLLAGAAACAPSV